ncbi:MAG: phosphate-starvation-inducible PsiE family protein [Syntrophotaleaceae bacterium]
MNKIFKMFEKVIVFALLGLMMVAIFVSTIELGFVLVQQLREPPVFLLNTKEMLEVFSFFLMVLIGLELLESIKAYLEEERVHAEVVILVALVAVSRKIIVLDYKEETPEMLFGIAAIIIGLSAGYFLVRHALHAHRNP